MQLRLSIEEFELLLQILREKSRMSCDETVSLLHVASEACLRDELPVGGDLFGKRISRNLPLALDELRDLAGSLDLHKKKLMRDLACSEDAAAKSKLESELTLLEHLLEKVSEACAMV